MAATGRLSPLRLPATTPGHGASARNPMPKAEPRLATQVLEALKGMTLMDAVALNKEVDKAFGLNKDDEEETTDEEPEEEAPAAEE